MVSTPGHTGSDVSVIVKNTKQGIVAVTGAYSVLDRAFLSIHLEKPLCFPQLCHKHTNKIFKLLVCNVHHKTAYKCWVFKLKFHRLQSNLYLRAPPNKIRLSYENTRTTYHLNSHLWRKSNSWLSLCWPLFTGLSILKLNSISLYLLLKLILTKLDQNVEQNQNDDKNIFQQTWFKLEVRWIRSVCYMRKLLFFLPQVQKFWSV